MCSRFPNRRQLRSTLVAADLSGRTSSSGSDCMPTRRSTIFRLMGTSKTWPIRGPARPVRGETDRCQYRTYRLEQCLFRFEHRIFHGAELSGMPGSSSFSGNFRHSACMRHGSRRRNPAEHWPSPPVCSERRNNMTVTKINVLVLNLRGARSPGGVLRVTARCGNPGGERS